MGYQNIYPQDFILLSFGMFRYVLMFYPLQNPYHIPLIIAIFIMII